MLIARLLRDEEGDPGAGPNQFGDDQVGPGPAEQDALIAIEIRQDAGDDDAREQFSFFGAKRERRLDHSDIKLARRVGDDQNLLEERADDNDGDLRAVINPEDGDRERAEGGRRQIAEEL